MPVLYVSQPFVADFELAQHGQGWSGRLFIRLNGRGSEPKYTVAEANLPACYTMAIRELVNDDRPLIAAPRHPGDWPSKGEPKSSRDFDAELDQMMRDPGGAS